MIKICPHCGEEIDSLDCRGTFYQREYGTCSGSYDLEDESTDMSIDDTQDSDGYEDEVDTYSCPECGIETTPDDLLDPDDVAENPEDYEFKHAREEQVIKKKQSMIVSSLLNIQ